MQETNILWWKTSVFPPAGTTDIYWMDPWALFWIEVVLMQFAELAAAGRCADHRGAACLCIVRSVSSMAGRSRALQRRVQCACALRADTYISSSIYATHSAGVTVASSAGTRRPQVVTAQLVMQDFRKPGSMGKQFFLGFENVLQGSGEPAYPGAPPPLRRATLARMDTRC